MEEKLKHVEEKMWELLFVVDICWIFCAREFELSKRDCVLD